MIRGAIAAFLLTCALLFFFSGRLTPTSRTEPGFVVDETARASPDGTFQVTLDASDRTHWIHFDLSAGAVKSVQTTESKADLADLIVRRHTLRAPHGAMNLGEVPLAAAHLDAHAAWVEDATVSGELQNAALAHWYSYSYWNHLLRSTGATYAVRLAAGGVAYFNLLSYYCKPEAPGCLTIRYRLDLESPQGR